MKKLALIVSTVLLLRVASAVAAEPPAVGKAEEEKTLKKQTVCPVMGGEVNRSIYVDANGKRVYFCCNACPAEFKKDPAKYLKKLEAEGVTLEKTPAATTTDPLAPKPPEQEKHQADEHGATQP